jgi:hypothetical protein
MDLEAVGDAAERGKVGPLVGVVGELDTRSTGKGHTGMVLVAVPHSEAERRCGNEQTDGQEAGADGRGLDAEKRNDGGADRRFASAREPAVLRATRVVHIRFPRVRSVRATRRWSHRPRTAS